MKTFFLFGCALRYALSYTLIFFSASFLFAQEKLPQAITELHAPEKPTAGDVVELTVTPFPDAKEATLAMADSLKQGPVELGKGRILWWKPFDPEKGTIVLGLTSYTPGLFEIDAIAFQKDGKTVFTSKPLKIEFHAVGGDPSQDDIYPPQSVGFPRWMWIALGIFLLALVLAVILILSRLSKKKAQGQVSLAHAPHILSPLEEFEKIKKEIEHKQFLEKGHYKAYYFGFSDATKQFLGKNLQFDAEEKTTRELVIELDKLKIKDSDIDEWEKIFHEMDITKFTDQTPTLEQSKSLPQRLHQLAEKMYTQNKKSNKIL